MNSLSGEVKQAYRNLHRNRRRSLITVLAILSGFVGLTLLAGYVARVERYLMVNSVYLNHNGHVQIYKKSGLDKYFSKPGQFLLHPSEVSELERVLANRTEIEAYFPYILGNGLLQSTGESFPFQGKGVTTDADRFTREHRMVSTWTNELHSNEQGSPLYQSSNDHPVMVTFKLNTALGNVKDINLQGLTTDNGFNAMDAQISSLYSTGLDLTEDTSMITTVPVLQELMGTDGYTFLGLYLKNDLKARSLTHSLNQEFERKNLPYEAHPFFDERIGLFYTGTMNFLYAMASFFFTLVSLVVILSIANAISMNIIERIRELGAMRAIGFSPKDLSKIVALESLMLASFAITVGYVIAQAIALAVNALNIRFSPPGIAGDMQFVLTPWTSVCFLLAVPLIFIAVVTAYFVTQAKVKGEVATLLTTSTT